MAGVEIEIKLRVRDAAHGRAMLEAAGFAVRTPRIFESNVVFDRAAGDLRANGELIRLRRVGSRAVFTYKGPSEPGPHKRRQEFEVEVSDGDIFARILQRLGLQPVFRYEKYRTEYAPPDRAGLAMLDETSIGVFLELEGPPEWIDRTAARLGFASGDYITASYGRLYLEHCQASGLTPSDMVFPPQTP